MLKFGGTDCGRINFWISSVSHFALCMFVCLKSCLRLCILVFLFSLVSCLFVLCII